MRTFMTQLLRRVNAQRAGATMLVLGMVATMGATFFVPPAHAATSGFTVPPGVTVTNGGENCNGVVPTPGSANTNKVLDPHATQDLNPGGTAAYLITFPSDPANVGDFQIVDCVLLVGPGGAPKDYKQVLGEVTFNKANNAADFALNFAFAIPPDAVNGDQICNVAKTTASPSKSPGSNRKAGPACFVIGGSGRVVKHDADSGALLDGATFSIHDCHLGAGANAALQPILVSLQNAAGTSIPGAPVPNLTTGLVSGNVSAASIAFNGPSGSSCQVTETAPPGGYNLPTVGTVTVLIGANKQTTYVFDDTAIPPQLTLAKTADAASVAAGQPIGFTIAITNAAGAATAHGVTIHDTLPTGDGISWSIAQTVNGCSITTGVLTCTLGDLAGGASRSVHVTSPTTTASCKAYQNTATVASTNASAGPASAISTVQCPGLNLAKAADAPLVDAGTPIGFTVTVSNTAGSAPASGVTISDPLPMGPGIAWSLNPAVTGCAITGGNQLNCTFATLAAGAQQAVHVVSPTTKDSCKAYPNVATLAASVGGTAHLADALATVQCPVVTLAKAADAPSVNAGEPIGFSLRVSNAGPATAKAVTVTDTLPAGGGLSWSISPGLNGNACTVAGAALNCSFGDVVGGTSRSVHITSPTTAADCKAIPNLATAAMDNGAAPDAASATVTVKCPALVLGKVADAASVAAGQPIGFTITVTNGADAGTASAVTVTDDLLAGDGVAWSVDPTSSGAALCAIAGSKLTCGFGDLVAGASRSVHVLSPTTAASCKTYDNTAKLTAANGSAPDATASTTADCPTPTTPAVVAAIVEATTTTTPSPTTAVLGVQIVAPAPLPVTGTNAVPLIRLAGIALMLGAMALLAGSRRSRPRRQPIS